MRYWGAICKESHSISTGNDPFPVRSLRLTNGRQYKALTLAGKSVTNPPPNLLLEICNWYLRMYPA
jgi:hypothetical protein